MGSRCEIRECLFHILLDNSAQASMFTGKYASEVGIHGIYTDFDRTDETIIEALQELRV